MLCRVCLTSPATRRVSADANNSPHNSLAIEGRNFDLFSGHMGLLQRAQVRLDSQEGTQGSAALGVQAYLWNSADGQHPKEQGVQWSTCTTVSISGSSACGVQAAGTSGCGMVQARPRAGCGRAGRNKALSSKIWQTATARRSQAARPGKRRPRWGDSAVSQVDPIRERLTHRRGRLAS